MTQATEEVFKYVPAEQTWICSYEANSKYDLKHLSDLPDVPGSDCNTPAECFVDILALDPKTANEPESADAPFAYTNEIDGPVKKGIIPGDHIFMSSDGLASSNEDKRETPRVHPRSFNNATRVLTKYVGPGLMDLRTAIRKMTSLPADKFNLQDRGRIEEGYFADIVVIDRKNLKAHAKLAEDVTTDFGLERKYSGGVEYSLVNGVLAIENGTATDQRAGKILRMSEGRVIGS